MDERTEENMFETMKSFADKYEKLTNEQISDFIFVKMKNDEYLFDFERIDFFYDCIGMIKNYGYEKTIDYLKSLECWDEDVLFTNPENTLSKLHERENIRRKDKIRPVLKGFKKCKSCGSDNVIDIEKQTRRADEEMTFLFFCVCCGKKVR